MSPESGFIAGLVLAFCLFALAYWSALDIERLRVEQKRLDNEQAEREEQKERLESARRRKQAEKEALELLELMSFDDDPPPKKRR